MGNFKWKNVYQQFIYKTAYARWDDDIQRREHWLESVERYENYLIDKIPNSKKTEFKKVCKGIKNLNIMPSMRMLWTAGKPLEKENICGYNCAYLNIDSVKTFSELLYILMCGTGAGFSVERQHINKLPEIPEKLKELKKEIVFADSRIGWADGYHKFISNLFKGKILKCDLSKIREKGARLKTMGGRASGPEPLQQLLDFTKNMFLSAQGRKLNSLECHDICCYIAEVVVAGGVRRSACLSLSNFSDKRMAHAKDGEFWKQNPQRRMANNSTAYTEKPDCPTFMEEWLNIARSGSGERGIFNREGTNFIVDQIGRREITEEYGCNPSLRKGTRVLTDKGVFNIEELQDKKMNIYNLNGKKSKAECFLSGKNKQLYKITLKGGSEYYATKKHKWPVFNKKENKFEKITTDLLQPKDCLPAPSIKQSLPFGTEGSYDDGFLIGWNLGDGSITKRKEGKIQIGFTFGKDDIDNGIMDKIVKHLSTITGSIYSPTIRQREGKEWGEIHVNNEKLREFFNKFGAKNKKEGLPNSIWNLASEKFRKGLIDGLFSSDGNVDLSGVGNINFCSCHKKMVWDVCDLLGFYGIKGSVRKSSTKNVSFPNGKNYNKIYIRYDIKISKGGSLLFRDIFKLTNTKKEENLKNIPPLKKNNSFHKKFIKIRSVEKTDIYEDVWDITVHDNDHCFELSHCITGNCSEVVLRSNEFCNLTEVVVRPTDTLNLLKKKVRQASILGCVQSTFTKFNFVNRKWKKNCEEERLLGVSLTGLRDHEILGHKSNKAKSWFREMKQEAIDTTEEWSKILEINMAAAITCVKPSGTVSQLVNSASGLHPRYSPYYIRRVRVSMTDPIAKYLISKEVPHNPEVGYTIEDCSTVVFEFPIKSPGNAVFRDETNALEQLEYWKMIQQCWCEHKPSCTVYVKSNEWLKVGSWVYDNWNYISGISFLPYDGGLYPLAPYEEITEEKHQELLENFPKLDFGSLKEYEETDNTTGAKEYACSGGSCEI